MIIAIDVHYVENDAYVAGVVFNDWTDARELAIFETHLSDIKAYQSGAFYKRELPCIVKLLSEYNLQPEFIVIDGFVFLDGENQPGLGKHLYDVLNDGVSIIGVAKNPFQAITTKHELLRGESKKPLYITSIGTELELAKKYILKMHGKFRMPTLIKKADTLCRALAGL